MNTQLSATGADRIRNAAHRAGVGVSATIRNRGGEYPQLGGRRRPRVSATNPQPGRPVSVTGYRDPVHGVRRIEVKGRKKGQPIRLTTNEWYKAQQRGDSFWLYVVWSPLDKPDPVPVMIQNPAKVLEHAAKPVVSARFWDIPADAIDKSARTA